VVAVEAGASADPRLKQVLGALGIADAYSIGADDPLALRHAAVSHHGILTAVDEDFLPLFRLEWPDWHGPLLPEAVRRLLAGGDAGRLPGRHVMLSVRHGADVSLLQIRRRVIADDLSPRERAVAELAAGGASYRDIAAALSIAPATARNHIAAVHRRLGVSRNAAIAALLAQAR
jgi:DNA-binding CsgD family transcriptional regulator